VRSPHPARGRPDVARLLLGFAALYGLLAGLAEIDATGRYGLVILAAVVVAAVVVERLQEPVRPRDALRALGLGRPEPAAVAVALVVGALVLTVYPLVSRLTGASFALKPGWPWLLLGIFAFHGLAEELVWRGYAFDRLRRGRSFGAAVVATMPLIAATHLPVIAMSGITVGVAAMLVAAGTSLPLAKLYEQGRNTLWAPAIVHTGIDSFKLVVIPDDARLTFSLTLAAASITIPLLALIPILWRRS
jgi:membrane protease YdiL (CAAX protease family)